MRKFKINNVSYEIVNICDSCYKYKVLELNNKGYWIELFKCNTLAEGKEKAYQIAQDREEQKQEYDRQKEEYNKHIEELKNKTIYCTNCNKELTLNEKIDHLEECAKCLFELYN